MEYINLTNVIYSKKVSYDDILSKDSVTVGIVLTFAVHVAIIGLMLTTGFSGTTYIPNEKGIEIELLDNNTRAGIPRNNRQRVIENPPIINDPGNTAPQSAHLAESNQSTRPTEQPDARTSELSDFGDIEKNVEKPKEVNQRALFQNTSQGTEDANNQHLIRDNSLFPGVGNNNEATRSPNTPIGPEHRQMVTASLDGRSVIGALPLPFYNSQNQGKVVVVVTVDQEGRVTKANARAQGSTVQDAALWKAAEEAALKARFNVKRDAPVFQTGTITYNFVLR
ncbi:MAG: TonB family protein [Prevotellaceae bacterium]|jgi:TonB family protein|nr:TonB family protein [Prevotellaceae bacterium]